VVHIPNFAPDPNPGGVLWEPEDYYLYVGVLEPHKGLLELAAAAALPGGPRVKVVGRGSLEGRLRSLQRRGLARIEVEGWVSPERLSHLYRHARALVIPSTWAENAPLVALEALAWGTPLLTSRRGGLSELLHEGTAGRSFEPTPEALVSAVEGFEAGDLARALRPGSRAAYAASHRPQGYVNSYIDLIQGRRGAAPAAHAAKETASGNRASVAALTSTAGLFP
jgi:glycosyltransferase involved in cell wall biosynthesis